MIVDDRTFKDIVDRFGWNSGLILMRVKRIMPEVWNNQPIFGYLGEFRHVVDEDYIEKHFGGGVYNVEVIGDGIHLATYEVRIPGEPIRKDFVDVGDIDNLLELMSKLNWDKESYKIHIVRLMPKVWKDQKVDGYVGLVFHSIDRNYIKNHFGGGIFDIKVWDIKKNNIYSSCRVKVPGDPFVASNILSDVEKYALEYFLEISRISCENDGGDEYSLKDSPEMRELSFQACKYAYESSNLSINDNLDHIKEKDFEGGCYVVGECMIQYLIKRLREVGVLTKEGLE
jgi:hypothetical protein